MYTAYFGLKEKPFSIAPDPQYLFMSDRHREALAHLTYGLGDAGGFVLLTGEVGTGKTTVSRCLMERLPENTQAAFILNPTLSSQELLATICDELKIKYRKTGATLKTLTDKIQEKLIKNHKNDINTLLIIDEAQHLQPEVLEQLRLLTNLETNTKKLLQVILIGQPELQTLLKRRDLRQLAQRITARYHLLPLNQQEVAQYIKHRLSIAECIRAVFSPKAMKTIHDICDGIPRLINLVCERSLLNAYSSNVATVDKKIVLVSAQEALGDEYYVEQWWQSSAIKWGTGLTLIAAVAVSAFWVGSNKEQLLNVADIDEQQIHKQSVVEDISQENLNNSQLIGNNITDSTHDDSKVVSDDNITLHEVDNNVSLNSIEKASLTKASNLADKPSAPREAIKVLVEEEGTRPTVSEKEKQESKPFEVKAVEGVSNEMLDMFKDAVDKSTNKNNSQEDIESNNNKNIEPLEKMPAWVQDGLPQLQFDQHIYASDGQGWVKVNGRDRYEGDNIARELILVQILPQKVVLNFRGEKFSMRALSSW